MGEKSLCDPEATTVNPKEDWSSQPPPPGPQGPHWTCAAQRGGTQVTIPRSGPIPSSGQVNKCQSQVKSGLSNALSQNNGPNHCIR